MGISLSPFQPGQVIGNQPSAAPDPLSVLLAALTQGNELGVRGLEEQGRNSRSSAENEIQKAQLALQGKKLDLEMADKKIELERQKAEGKALADLMPFWIQSGQAPQNPNADAPQGQQGAMQPAPQGAASPLGGLEQVVAALPPELRVGFLKSVLQPTENAQKQYDDAQAEAVATAQRQAIIDNAVAGLPEGDRENARRAFGIGALKLPKEVADPIIQRLWGKEWTSESVNAAVNFAKTMSSATGQPIPFGKVAALLGMKAPANLADAKFTAPKEEWRPTVQQISAAAQFKNMQGPFKFLQAASNVGNPGLAASFLRNFKGGVLPETALNALLPDAMFSSKDKEYLQSLRVFVDSYVRVVSGAQVNADEFSRFMLSLGEAAGDTREVRQRKARARTAIMGAIFDISQQKLAGSASLDQLLSSGDLGTLSAEDRRVFEKLRTDAVTYESTGRIRQNFSPANQAPLTPDAATNLSNSIPVGR